MSKFGDFINKIVLIPHKKDIRHLDHGEVKYKFMAESAKAYRTSAYPRFQQCKPISGEPPPEQDTSLSLVYLPQPARYPFTAWQTEVFGAQGFSPLLRFEPRIFRTIGEWNNQTSPPPLGSWLISRLSVQRDTNRAFAAVHLFGQLLVKTQDQLKSFCVL